ncbi:MAG: DUF3040 domain-containing protein [Ilumatobacteraceae bacterium]
MPLSEDEQRILRQIERELEQDPSFADGRVRVSRQRLALSAFGMIIGIVATVLSLSVSFVVSFVVFGVELVLGTLVVCELRLLCRERLGESPLAAWIAAARAQRPR